MVKETICTGKTVEEALEKAYAELGANSDNSEFEILERPARKLFGLKVIPAKVKVTMRVEEAPVKPAAIKNEPRSSIGKAVEQSPRPQQVERPAKKPAPVKQALEREKLEKEAPIKSIKEDNAAVQEKVACAVAYLKAIFKEMGLAGVEISAAATKEGAVLTLGGEGLGVLIGRRGETLDALQYLSGLVANRLEGDYFRITIDSGNYREKREKTLEQLARKLAAQVLKTGRNLTLEPMNPYERRIIHATVQTIDGVTSSSVGEEPNRKVVISCTQPRKKKEGQNRRGRGGRGRGGRGRNAQRSTSNVVTRPEAFEESTKRVSEPRKQHIDDSNIEIDPPAIRSQALSGQVAAPSRAVPAEAKDKPLYSKIELD